MRAPVLLFGYGNPSRGDDALGPLLLDRIEPLRCRHPEWPPLELLTDFQLQVEHVLDVADRRLVLFIDADLAASVPFSCRQVRPSAQRAYTSHALDPGELLGVYERVLATAPPPAYVLGIQAFRFELGEPLSSSASANLDAAVAFVAELLSHPDPVYWEESVHA